MLNQFFFSFSINHCLRHCRQVLLFFKGFFPKKLVSFNDLLFRRKELHWREELKKKAAEERAKENKRELELRDEMMRRVAHSALREREISTKVYHLVDDEITRIHDTDACSIM